MGVDVASVRNLNVRISEHPDERYKPALFIGEVRDFDELGELMERYQVDMCAIDGQPERLSVLNFADRFPGRVYIISYGTGPLSEPLVPDPENRKATVDRTHAIDTVLYEFRQRYNQLPRTLPPDYRRHLQAAVRKVERDNAGRKRPRYLSLGPDDYLHSEVYDWAAWWLLCWQGKYCELWNRSQATYMPVEEAIPGFVHADLSSYTDPDDYPGGFEARIRDSYDY